jgi:hypothetical protein
MMSGSTQKRTTLFMARQGPLGVCLGTKQHAHPASPTPEWDAPGPKREVKGRLP